MHALKLSTFRLLSTHLELNFQSSSIIFLFKVLHFGAVLESLKSKNFHIHTAMQGKFNKVKILILESCCNISAMQSLPCIYILDVYIIQNHQISLKLNFILRPSNMEPCCILESWASKNMEKCMPQKLIPSDTTGLILEVFCQIKQLIVYREPERQQTFGPWKKIRQKECKLAAYKGLESDPSKSPPAQQHFATVLDFH